MVTFFFQISVATCAVRRPQMRGATSSYGDQLKDTAALTPHSTSHSVTARQHATHHTLSPLNAKRPRAKTRGGGTPHKHTIPTASKRPGARGLMRRRAVACARGTAPLRPPQAPTAETRAETRQTTRAKTRPTTRAKTRRAWACAMGTATHDLSEDQTTRPRGDPSEDQSGDQNEDPTNDPDNTTQGAGGAPFRRLGPPPGATHLKETPPTPNQRPPKPQNDKAHSAERGRPPPHPYFT